MHTAPEGPKPSTSSSAQRPAGDGRLAVVISEEAIRARVAELAAEITRDYEARDLVLVCLLKGAVLFFADLCRAVRLPVKVEFLRAASYGRSARSSGQVRIDEIGPVELEGRDVLLIEDVVDSGLTLARILDFLRERNPRSLEVCALLYKSRGVDHPFRVRYIGFRIEDRFVVGYGLDYGERYRNLPYIAVLEA